MNKATAALVEGLARLKGPEVAERVITLFTNVLERLEHLEGAVTAELTKTAQYAEQVGHQNAGILHRLGARLEQLEAVKVADRLTEIQSESRGNLDAHGKALSALRLMIDGQDQRTAHLEGNLAQLATNAEEWKAPENAARLEALETDGTLLEAQLDRLAPLVDLADAYEGKGDELRTVFFRALEFLTQHSDRLASLEEVVGGFVGRMPPELPARGVKHKVTPGCKSCGAEEAEIQRLGPHEFFFCAKCGGLLFTSSAPKEGSSSSPESRA